MTTITAQHDTRPEGAAATEFEVEASASDHRDTAILASDTREVSAAQAPDAGSGSGFAPAGPTPSAAPQPTLQPAPQPALQPAPQGPAFAITSFVLGLASIVSGWTFFAPIVGLILGILALRRGTPERALALWGVWLNGAMLALSLIGIVVFGALLGAGILALPFLA